MNTTELKLNFHKLIDSMDNIQLLAKFYGLMVSSKSSSETPLWDKLRKEQKDELILSDLESEDLTNLIPDKTIKQKHAKWL